MDEFWVEFRSPSWKALPGAKERVLAKIDSDHIYFVDTHQTKHYAFNYDDLKDVIYNNPQIGLNIVVLYLESDGLLVPGLLTCTRGEEHVIELADGDIIIGPLPFHRKIIPLSGASMTYTTSWSVTLGDETEKIMRMGLSALGDSIGLFAGMAFMAKCPHFELIRELMPKLESLEDCKRFPILFEETEPRTHEECPDRTLEEREPQSFRATAIESIRETLLPQLHSKIIRKLVKNTEEVVSEEGEQIFKIHNPVNKLLKIDKEIRAYKTLKDVADLLMMPWDYVSDELRERIVTTGISNFAFYRKIAHIFRDVGISRWPDLLDRLGFVVKEEKSLDDNAAELEDIEIAFVPGPDDAYDESDSDDNQSVGSNDTTEDDAYHEGVVEKVLPDSITVLLKSGRLVVVQPYEVTFDSSFYRTGMKVETFVSVSEGEDEDDDAAEGYVSATVISATDSKIIVTIDDDEDGDDIHPITLDNTDVRHVDHYRDYIIGDKVIVELADNRNPYEEEDKEESAGLMYYWRRLWVTAPKLSDAEVVEAAADELKDIPESVWDHIGIVRENEVKRMVQLKKDLFYPRVTFEATLDLRVYSESDNERFPHPAVTKELLNYCKEYYSSTCMDFVKFSNGDDDKDDTDNDQIVGKIVKEMRDHVKTMLRQPTDPDFTPVPGNNDSDSDDDVPGRVSTDYWRRRRAIGREPDHIILKSEDFDPFD